MSLSAKRLGYELGLTAQEVNVLLEEEGFLSGEPGNYTPTEKGEDFSISKDKDNGYGGYAARSWEWLEWDESIIADLNVTPEKRAHIKEKTAEQRRQRRAERDAQSEAYWASLRDESEEDASDQISSLLDAVCGIADFIKKWFR